MSENKTSVALSFIAGGLIVTLAILLGYYMRGGDVRRDARLESLKLVEKQLTEISQSVGILVNSDESYWNGYSEGLTACHAYHP